MADYDVQIRFEGAIWTDEGRQIVRRAVEQGVQDTSDWAEHRVLERLDEVIRVNRHVYTSHIRVDRVSEDRYDVTDGGVIYGPWLEGTGSRNSPKTRFPGYFTFRQVETETEGRAEEIMDRVLDERVREL
jgi:hypothetical protein